ncbi:MAG: TolC family protein [Deltaproteobacteria bacterium]|nr:TolC family protein [Deltaproteobacteria bacterium]
MLVGHRLKALLYFIMIMGHIALIHLFIIFTCHPAYALTLEELITEAKGKNPELAALKEMIRAKEERVSQQGYLEDPTFKVELEDISRDRPLRIAPSQTMLTRYTISQSFPFPGKLWLKEKIASKDALIGRELYKARELEIIASIKDGYYEYSYIIETIRTTEDIKALVMKTAEAADIRYFLGEASQQDVIKINLEISSLINDLIMLDARKAIEEAKLKQLAGLPYDQPIGEPLNLFTGTAGFSLEELMDSALNENPAIKAIKKEIEKAGLEKELSQKDFYPDFMIGAAPIQRDNDFESFDLMFQINIPLWRGKYKSRVNEAGIDAASLMAELTAAKNMKALEIKEASIAEDSAGKTLVLYEKGH